MGTPGSGFFTTLGRTILSNRRRGKTRRRAAASLAGVLAAAACLAASAETPAYRDAAGDLTMALTGDTVLTRRLAVHEEPGFLELRDLLRGADAAFANLEMLFHEYGEDIVPAAHSGGTYMQADPALAGELAWMGFDLVSRANNHAMDYGAGGMRATTRTLEEAGLVHAGVGENLTLARAPAYLDTRAGRVALVSLASTYPDGAEAGPSRADVRGRPGLAPLPFGTLNLVPPDRLAVLKELRDELSLPWEAEGETLRFGDQVFAPGDGFRRVTKLYDDELRQIIAVVREAERQASWVVVSSHTHEAGDGRRDPPRFLVELAHAAIDAGADMVVGHGPHVLRGIEIYKGRPVFYSLGNFVFQNETVARQPQDNFRRYRLDAGAHPGEFQDARNEAMGGGFEDDRAYWESVVAVPAFRNGDLHEIRLHPVTLGHGLPRSQRGRPMLAGDELSERIIGELTELSAPFGTKIEFRQGIGVIRP